MALAGKGGIFFIEIYIHIYMERRVKKTNLKKELSTFLGVDENGGGFFSSKDMHEKRRAGWT